MNKQQRRIQKLETLAGIRVQRVLELSDPLYKYTAVVDLATGKSYGFSMWFNLYPSRWRDVTYEEVKSFADCIRNGDYGERFPNNRPARRRW